MGSRMDRALSTGVSALVVDDDPGVRQSLRLCLEVDGIRVLGVGTNRDRAHDDWAG